MPDTVMIVDDNPENLDVLGRLLHDSGYRVRPASSGRMALKALEHSPADLIMLDIMMPEMDGYAVCRRLKENPATCEIPVIFISALGHPQDKVKAFDSGGVDYVSKPFNNQEVLARVAAHLQLRRLQLRLEHANQELEQAVAVRTAELREANAALEKALRVKRDFLMLMSHEFRTPLNGILGMAQSLKQCAYVDGEERTEYIEIIEQSGWRMLKLVDDILQLTRQGVAASVSSETAAPVEIGQFCAETLNTVSALAEQKKLAVELEVGQIPALAIQMGGAYLRQILGNLLDNAIKFTPPGGRFGVQVSFCAERKTLDIHVWDTGPGIPPADCQRIFEPFMQLQPPLTRSHQGPGLGLTLARNLVTLYGGKIQVMARPGGGSIFQISLPAMPADAAGL